jgi:hypothetical protein
MVNNHKLSISDHDSHPLAQYKTPWFRTTGWAKHTILSFWNSMCYSEPVAVNHGVLLWASDCESWCVMLNQGLGIPVRYAELVNMNHCELCSASCCESLWGMPSRYTPWFTVTSSQQHTMIHSHWLRIAHTVSERQVQLSTKCFATTGSV